MSLIPKTPAQEIAERIDRSQTELIRHIESQLKTMYAAVNTAGLQQEVLDAFGNQGVAALTKYEAMRQAVAAINPESNIQAPNTDEFVAQEDGTVLYVAPVIPEAEV